MFEKKVELVSFLANPHEDWDVEDPASCGARGCFSEKSSSDIHLEEISKEDYSTRRESIFAETSGRGHGAVLDQSSFCFSIDNLTRASTLFLCAPEYASHLQQSLRRATAERSFFLPESLSKPEANNLMRNQFSLYSKMQEAGVPSEDARFILPLGTKTAIQSTVNARELMHLYTMAQGEGVPSEISDTANQMYSFSKSIASNLMKDRKNNFEVLSWWPSSQLFIRNNKTLELMVENSKGVQMISSSTIPMDGERIKYAITHRDEAELANLKHMHFTFLAPMSLAAFHQMTRQRTLNQSVEPIYNAIKRGDFVVPPSIQQKGFLQEYSNLNKESIEFVNANLENPDSLMVLPHSLIVYDLMHVNGWNALGFIAKRTCVEAQWEIREIAKEIALQLKSNHPSLGKFSVPQGILYGKCPEKNSCHYCDGKDINDL
jgi:thymidylate synthase (FAD)